MRDHDRKKQHVLSRYFTHCLSIDGYTYQSKYIYYSLAVFCILYLLYIRENHDIFISSDLSSFAHYSNSYAFGYETSFFHDISSNLWNPLIQVNASCPRFIFTHLKNEGLGDQLEHMYTGLALAYKYKSASVTFVVDDTFGMISKHQNLGYGQIFYYILGLPHFKRLSSIRGRYMPTEIHGRWNRKKYGKYLKGHTNFIEDVPCGYMFMVDIKKACESSW